MRSKNLKWLKGGGDHAKNYAKISRYQRVVWTHAH